MSRYGVGEMLLILVFTGCVVFQLFVPPSIGLANNGDFARMIGRFSLAPGSLDSSEENKYFTSRWVYKQSYQWVSDNYSSELILISAALLIGWEFSSAVFDIRILGAIHALIWIGWFAALLPLFARLERWRAFVPALAALFIFTDVSYVAYCNSFHTDTAGFLFLSWAVVLWLHFLLRGRPSVKLHLMFCVASILCVGSKPQHAVLGPFLFTLAVLAAVTFQGRPRKIAAAVFGVLILLAAFDSYIKIAPTDKLEPQYSTIFNKILKHSANPLDDLSELGLGPEYLRFVGYWPSPGAYDPTRDEAWSANFLRQTSNGRIVRFYLRHPWRALVIVYGDLHGAARDRRPPNIGNYEKQYGLAPGALTTSFGWWSYLRSTLFRFAPWHILVWYAVMIAMGVRLAIRHRNSTGWRVPLLCVLVAGMGLVELATSSLADAGETDRHLFLFHAITDFTILFAVVWAVKSGNLRKAPVSEPRP